MLKGVVQEKCSSFYFTDLTKALFVA